MYYAIHTPDIDRAKAFYQAVFGWTFRSDNHIDGSSPAGGLGEGDPGIEIYFEVPDAAAMAEKARALGGTATEPVRSKSGWTTEIGDGHGGTLLLWQPADGYGEAEPKCAAGDLFYYVLMVENDAAKQFHADLLGLELTPGSHPGGSNIVNTRPVGGIFVHHAASPDPNFQVMDIDAALAKITAAGGVAGERQPNQAGWHASCQDDQGVAFGIGSLRQD